MSSNKRVLVRERIGSFIEKTEIVRHFMLESILRETIYHIINRFESGISAQR